MRGQLGRRAVLVHHVGELVVAVHEPGDEVDRLVRAQPRRRLVEAGQLAALDALEERGPPVDLALVEAVGPAEVLQALGLPVDLAEQRDALDQLVGQALAGVEVGVERRRPAVGVHRRPAVDEAHQVEGAAEHRRVLAHADGRGVRHVGAVERLDDAPLAQDALVAVGRAPSAAGCGSRRGGRRAGSRRSRSGCRRRRSACSSGSPLPARPCVVHPGREPVEVDHRFPTSCSRYSAYFALAAASFFGQVLGRPQVVGRLVVAEHLPGDGDLVHLGRAVGEAHDAGAEHHAGRTASRC